MTVVVIGSGPAGVSVAWPLVQAGFKVLMVDASGSAALPEAPAGDIGAFRRAPDRWRTQFGATLAGLGAAGDLSPKLATPAARAAIGGFAEALGMRTSDFHGVGSLRRGGLSTIWGAMAPTYAPADFAGFPITADDLAPSYAAVSERIGVSTAGVDGPALTEAPRRLLERAQRCGPLPTVIGPAQNAVLMADRDGRFGCANCGLCLWGCARRSIYSSADELDGLRRFGNFSYGPAVNVRALRPTAGGHAVEADGVSIEAEHVVLAAGTIGSTVLAARRLGRTSEPFRLLTNPVAAAAFVIPSLIGTALPTRSFGLAQLRHSTAIEAGGTAEGAVYGGDTLPLTEIARRIPLSRPAALRLSHALAPALLFTTIYLPGDYSDNTMVVGAADVAIEGRIGDAARQAFGQVRRKLSRTMRALGAYPVPLSFTVSAAGADAHYAGTFPMGGACSALGALHEAPGITIVDGAVLSALPAKHCTLTIMANADRIGRALAVRLVTDRLSAR